VGSCSSPVALLKRHINQSGDTIVEVLIAIAIAAFAIGTSYAIANRSLQQAITARERNQAINLSQNQISALKIRYINDKNAFKGTDSTYDNPATGFAVKTTTVNPVLPSGYPVTDFHFCLDEQSASPTDSTHQWARIANNFASDSEADNISSTNKYTTTPSPGCVRNIGGTDYFVDISAQITLTSKDATNRTVYKVAVRWAQVGSAANGESIIYYRI
jgi:Tfp pilus assembly protein PilV